MALVFGFKFCVSFCSFEFSLNSKAFKCCKEQTLRGADKKTDSRNASFWTTGRREPLNAPFLNELFSRRFPRGKTAR